MDERQELIDKIINKKKRLSYSWLKNFTSPRNFIDYKLKPRTQNAGMIFGSVCDVLLLTPEDFDKDFVVVNNQPSTELQVEFVNTCAEYISSIPVPVPNEELEQDLIEVGKNIYKRASDIDKAIKSFLPNIWAEATGKKAIGADIYEKAKNVTENLLRFEDVALLLESKTSAQKKLLWEFEGWPMICFLDFTTKDRIFDLKFDSQLDPDNFGRTVHNMGYDMQAGTYVQAAIETQLFGEQIPGYGWLAYDDKGNYLVAEMDWTYINYGIRKFKHAIESLERCIKEDAWSESFNFFNRSITLTKPRWAKGYELKSDSDGLE